MQLPYDLIKRCRTVFLRCGEFDSRESLRTVFISAELWPFRTGLKDANSPEGVVDLFLDFILERNITGGKAAFPVFLATLRDRYSDETKDELTQLLEEVQAYEAPLQTAASAPSIPPQVLHERLMTLDFRPQVRQFRDVITDHRIAAFLVHGPPLHGQRLLTRRLIRFREEWSTGQRIVIDATSNGIGKSSRALWYQIANKLRLPYDTDKQILAEKVCEWWKTQDVIFVFVTVDYIPPDLLTAWLEEFWKPIAAAANQRLPLTPSNTHLLLFLLDFSGHVCETTVSLLDQPGEIVRSYAPLKLPPTGKIREEELEIWIDNAAEVLPGKMDAFALIRDTDNGTPDLLYEKIFASCGLFWEGVELP
jgi:inactive STAND